MDDEFDVIESGIWLRGRDYVGSWCLFVVKDVAERQGTYGKEMVATFDFADLFDESPLQKGVKMSDQFIVDKLAPGKKIVGLVSRGEPKQKGWQGPVYLEQPPGAAYEIAKGKARALLNGETQTQPVKPKDDLEDLLS